VALRLLATFIVLSLCALPVAAQTPPSPAEAARYAGLHAAASQGDAARIAQLLAAGASPNSRDGHGRTPLQVATFAKRREAVRALANGGADLGALDNDRYDAVTIAAVADAMRNRGPRAVVVTIAGCGHAPTLNTPEQYALVERFFAA
jgi:ankyrin repeat protein